MPLGGAKMCSAYNLRAMVISVMFMYKSIDGVREDNIAKIYFYTNDKLLTKRINKDGEV